MGTHLILPLPEIRHRVSTLSLRAASPNTEGGDIIKPARSPSPATPTLPSRDK